MPAHPDPTVQRRRQALGRVVRRHRRQLGLSQGELADRARCDRQSINRVENAAYSPSLDRLFLLADALNVSLGALFVAVDADLAAEARQVAS
jgi:transcriptional regulator with XRE-family HTH domain